METLFNWLAGRGEFQPTVILEQSFILKPNESKPLLNIDGNEGDLRFLLIEITSSTSAENARLIIKTDDFYFNYKMGEMQNYNLSNMQRDFPSLIVADPIENRYVVLFKPFPPLHFNNKIIIQIVNEDSDRITVKYTISYSEVSSIG